MRKRYLLIALLASFLFLTPKLVWASTPADWAMKAGWKIGQILTNKNKNFKKPGLWKWLSGPEGVVEGLLWTGINAFTGAPVESGGDWSGGGDNGGNNGGGGGGFNYVPKSLPVGSIPLPVGTNGQPMYLSPGLLGYEAYFTGAIMDSPPASGVYYAMNILDNLTGRPVYAGSKGTNLFGDGMATVLRVWRSIRDISYLALSLVFLIVGLGIMLRVKLSSQTTMSITNALPKLIGVLILITFSYAIAGFVIDLMWVLEAVILQWAKAAHIGGWYITPDINTILKESIWHEIRFAWWKSGTSAVGVKMPVGTAIVGTIGGLLAIITGVVGMGGGAAIAVGIILLVSLGALFYIFFKLIAALIKTYLNIVLLIIFSPLYILAGALPGNQGGFGNWLKNLVANALVFPALTLAFILAGEFTKSGMGLDEFGLPHIGNAWGSPGFLLALGMLFVLPSIPDMIRQMFGIRGGGVGAAAIAAMAPIAGMAMFAPRQIIGTVQGGIQRAGTEKITRYAQGLGPDGTSIESSKLPPFFRLTRSVNDFFKRRKS